MNEPKKIDTIYPLRESLISPPNIVVVTINPLSHVSTHIDHYPFRINHLHWTNIQTLQSGKIIGCDANRNRKLTTEQSEQLKRRPIIRLHIERPSSRGPKAYDAFGWAVEWAQIGRFVGPIVLPAHYMSMHTLYAVITAGIIASQIWPERIDSPTDLVRNKVSTSDRSRNFAKNNQNNVRVSRISTRYWAAHVTNWLANPPPGQSTNRADCPTRRTNVQLVLRVERKVPASVTRKRRRTACACVPNTHTLNCCSRATVRISYAYGRNSSHAISGHPATLETTAPRSAPRWMQLIGRLLCQMCAAAVGLAELPLCSRCDWIPLTDKLPLCPR